ncbi:MAG: hypothetical protein JWO42_3148 [Chloroflexi bacterium]|nr:hypothetical protein [Chloroflexota bacterium]
MSVVCTSDIPGGRTASRKPMEEKGATAKELPQ